MSDLGPSFPEATLSASEWSQGSSLWEFVPDSILNGAFDMSYMEEEKKSECPVPIAEQIIDGVPSKNEASDSEVSLGRIDDELKDMTKYRIALREEQLRR